MFFSIARIFNIRLRTGYNEDEVPLVMRYRFGQGYHIVIRGILSPEALENPDDF